MKAELCSVDGRSVLFQLDVPDEFLGYTIQHQGRYFTLNPHSIHSGLAQYCEIKLWSVFNHQVKKGPQHPDVEDIRTLTFSNIKRLRDVVNAGIGLPESDTQKICYHLDHAADALEHALYVDSMTC